MVAPAKWTLLKYSASNSYTTVQDLVIKVRVVRYCRACYQTLDGRTVIAPLPAEVSDHFGPNLVRYLLSQHYQCRVTMPLLRQQLQDIGLLISAGQISNLLTKDYDAFNAEKAAVKQAGTCNVPAVIITSAITGRFGHRENSSRTRFRGIIKHITNLIGNSMTHK